MDNDQSLVDTSMNDEHEVSETLVNDEQIVSDTLVNGEELVMDTSANDSLLVTTSRANEESLVAVSSNSNEPSIRESSTNDDTPITDCPLDDQPSVAELSVDGEPLDTETLTNKEPLVSESTDNIIDGSLTQKELLSSQVQSDGNITDSSTINDRGTNSQLNKGGKISQCVQWNDSMISDLIKSSELANQDKRTKKTYETKLHRQWAKLRPGYSHVSHRALCKALKSLKRRRRIIDPEPNHLLKEGQNSEIDGSKESFSAHSKAAVSTTEHPVDHSAFDAPDVNETCVTQDKLVRDPPHSNGTLINDNSVGGRTRNEEIVGEIPRNSSALVSESSVNNEELISDPERERGTQIMEDGTCIAEGLVNRESLVNETVTRNNKTAVNNGTSVCDGVMDNEATSDSQTVDKVQETTPDNNEMLVTEPSVNQDALVTESLNNSGTLVNEIPVSGGSLVDDCQVNNARSSDQSPAKSGKLVTENTVEKGTSTFETCPKTCRLLQKPTGGTGATVPETPPKKKPSKKSPAKKEPIINESLVAKTRMTCSNRTRSGVDLGGTQAMFLHFMSLGSKSIKSKLGTTLARNVQVGNNCRGYYWKNTESTLNRLRKENTAKLNNTTKDVEGSSGQIHLKKKKKGGKSVAEKGDRNIGIIMPTQSTENVDQSKQPASTPASQSSSVDYSHVELMFAKLPPLSTCSQSGDCKQRRESIFKLRLKLKEAGVGPVLCEGGMSFNHVNLDFFLSSLIGLHFQSKFFQH